MVYSIYAQHYSGRRAIFWIDNDAARLSLIKTVSASSELLVMAQCFHSYGESDNVACWFERVPSESNVAGLPSRGAPEEAARLVNGEVRGDLQLPSDVCESLINDEMYEAISTLSQNVPLPKHDVFGGDAYKRCESLSSVRRFFSTCRLKTVFTLLAENNPCLRRKG